MAPGKGKGRGKAKRHDQQQKQQSQRGASAEGGGDAAAAGPQDVDIDERIATLRSKLEVAARKQQHRKAAKVAQDLLTLVPEDLTAKQCLLVALIHSDQVDKAAAFAKRQKPEGLAGLELEHAYCLYRTGRIGAALDTLEGVSDPAAVPGLLELKAQLLYRLGRVEESRAIYASLLEGAGTRGMGWRATAAAAKSPDLVGNAIAAHLAAGRAADVPPLLRQCGVRDALFRETPEAAYNFACLALHTGDLARADSLLGAAERIGRDAMAADMEAEGDGEGDGEGAAEAEEAMARRELAHVFAQRAFVGRELGTLDAKAAAECYGDVLRALGSAGHGQESTMAVAVNNLAACRGTTLAFDTLKRFDRLKAESKGATSSDRHATSSGGGSGSGRRYSLEGGLTLGPEVEQGLSPAERCAVMTNYAAVAIAANRLDVAQSTLSTLLSSRSSGAGSGVGEGREGGVLGLPQHALAAMVDAKAAEEAEGGVAAALARLKTAGEGMPGCDPVQVAAAMAEVACTRGRWRQAAQALLSLPADAHATHAPALAATAMDLFLRAGDVSSAAAYVSEGVEVWERRRPALESEGGNAMGPYAAFMLLAGRFLAKNGGSEKLSSGGAGAGKYAATAAQCFERVLEATGGAGLLTGIKGRSCVSGL